MTTVSIPVAPTGADDRSAGTRSSRISVLDLRDTHEIGGPGKTILETFRTIDRSRFDLHLGIFVVPGEPTDTPFSRAARECGLPVHVIDGSSRFDPRLIARTAALVRGLGLHILHAHEVKSDVIALLTSRLQPVATMATLHGWIGNSARQRAMIALDRRAVRHLDRVVVVSRKMEREVLEAGVPAARVCLVHNGIVLENYRRTGRRGWLRELLRRDVPGPVLSAIGRLSREKGHADLVEALAAVAAAGHRVSAVLAGDGPERGPLEALVAARGLGDRVFFPGYVAEPWRLLEETDLMVLPSHTEGLPNVALEALAMDVPVLATAVGGTPDVIIDQVTGRLVPPHDPRALASAIGDFLARRDDWQRTAADGRRMVEQRFDFAARTRRMEQLYVHLAEGVRRRA